MIEGIDLSHWQGTVQWPLVDRRYAFIKATEGDGWIDDQFALNWKAAEDENILRSAYHFWRRQLDGRAQAGHFFEVVSATGHLGEIPPVLDIEDTAAAKGGTIALDILECLQEIERLFNRKPIIYTAQWWWNPWTLINKNFGHYDLWVAYYGSSLFLSRYMPAGWSAWQIWQYSSKGSVPGVQGNCDLDKAQDAWFQQFVTPPSTHEVEISVPSSAEKIIITINRED